jgi:hypothetical protein
MEYPTVPCGTVTLSTGNGDVECCFVLDMAGTEAERMLLRAMDDLRRARHQVESCFHVLQDLVAHPPEGNRGRQVLEEARRLLEDFAPDVHDPTTQGRW